MSDVLFQANAKDVETVRGTLGKKTFFENGFLICRFNPDPTHVSHDSQGGRRQIATVIGNMDAPLVGQVYEFTGTVEFSAKYKCYQLRFDSYRTILPTDSDGIASYLIDVAKWVGPSTAKALLDAFGKDTLEVIKNEPEKVAAANIPGLTAERAGEMSKSLKANADLEAATVELNNLLGGALGPATVRKAIKRWKCNAASRIKENPYILTELRGIGFASADAVHTKIGGDPRSIFRHAAAVLHILQEAANRDGHTIVDRSYVEQEARKLIGGLLPEVWDFCTKAETIEGLEGTVALAGLSRAEQYIVNKIGEMLTTDAAGPELFPEIDAQGLAPDQAEAVKVLQDAPVGILTGAPGTGKTYTLARIVESLTRAGLRLSLAAPTGKAAKQMSIALAAVGGGTAVTIHSLLEPTIDEEGDFVFARGENNPLDCNILVVDEFSMVDVSLCRKLLSALPATARLIIVGDHYQLPSVGPGAVLRDLLTAGVPSYELKAIKRNAGRIVKACHAVKDGRIPEPSERLDLATGENWRHIDASGPEQIKETISAILKDHLKPFGIDPLWGVQMISPTNESGPLSCEVFNELGKSLLNPRPNADRLKFAVNDKIVRTKNGYAEGHYLEPDGSPGPFSDEVRIVNGDLGIVLDIDSEHVTVGLRYPDRVVKIARKEHLLKLAYCLTCHKMQGSEVDVVVLPLHRDLAKLPMTTREWIYTALSRGKKFVITVGDLAALNPMIRSVGNTRRRTTTSAMLKKMLDARPVSGKPEFDDL